MAKTKKISQQKKTTENIAIVNVMFKNDSQRNNTMHVPFPTLKYTTEIKTFTV